MKNLSVKENFWFNHVESFLNSGMQQKDYCKKHGLNPKSFSVRKSEYMKRQRSDNTKKFIALTSNDSIKIKLSSGTELTFEKVPDPAWIGAVLKELGSDAHI